MVADVVVRWAGQKAARHYPGVVEADLCGMFGEQGLWYEARLLVVDDPALRQPHVRRHHRMMIDDELCLAPASSWSAGAELLGWLAPEDRASPARYRPTGI